MKKRPIGVTVVAVLTLCASLAFGLLQLVITGLSGVGGLPSSPSFFFRLILSFPSLIALSVFALSMGQFGGARWAWYGSMVFWVLCLIGFGLLAYIVGHSNGFIGFLFALIPLAYAAGCAGYFLTRNARNYFNDSRR